MIWAAWHAHVLVDNHVGEWLGHYCNKECEDFFKGDKRERKGVPIPGIVLSQGQTDENRPDQVFAIAAIAPTGKKIHHCGYREMSREGQGRTSDECHRWDRVNDRPQWIWMGLFKIKGNKSFYRAWLSHTFSHSLPCSTMFPRSHHPFTTGKLLLAHEDLQNIRSVPSVLLFIVTHPGCYWPRCLGIPCFLFPYSSVISRILPNLQDFSSSQDLHLFRIIFFPRPLLTGIFFSASSSFQTLNSPVFPV